MLGFQFCGGGGRLAAFSGIGVLFLATTVWGQPAHAPPSRITIEEATKQLGGPTRVTLQLMSCEEVARRVLKLTFRSGNLAGDGPAVLVWDLPTEVSKIVVPFTVADISLDLPVQ